MSHSILNAAVIKAKSEELRIPFANLAVGFVTEEFLVQVSESEYASCLWMKNAGNFRLDYYKRKIPDSPVFYFHQDRDVEGEKTNGREEVTQEHIETMMKKLCEKKSGQNIIWEYDVIQKDRNYTVNIVAFIENIRIPFQVKIESAPEEELFPGEASIRLCMRNNDVLKLKAYPMEHVVVECIFEIMEKLELINDMSYYQRLYSILKKQTLDGRKVQLQLLDKYERRNLKPRNRSMTLLLGYKKYAYMKKKWKAYLKSENRKNPEWEEVMDMLEHFLAPIWEMLCSDMIFIGDWMPELARFFE